jgi:O-methyltransferase involved in polyketide biosynthesis
VYPEDTLPRVNGLPDWEHPASIRADDWLQAICTAGDTHEVVIAEGLLIYHWAEHLPYFDRKLWVEVSEAVFRTRKQADTRWGPIPDAYITHIWAAFLQYGQPPGDPASYDRFSGIAPVRPRDMDRLARQYWDASPGSEART